MSDEAYPGLRRAARAADPDPNTPETENETDETEGKKPKSGNKKDDSEMTEQEINDANAKAKAEGVTEGKAAGFAEANARATAVMASEHYAGNEKLAASLLAKDALSATDIIESLEAANPAPSASASDDDDAKQRAEMRQNLAAEQPGKTGGEGEAELNADDDSLVQGMKARFPDAK